jgi:crotonobetainyl-CoA:carnitine CoA-transferase CaiB-like acyl-CoA transferase
MTSATSAANGLRVIEYAGPGAGIAAAYAGWLLSRVGAQVTRLTSPGAAPQVSGDPVQLACESLAIGKAVETMPTEAANLVACLAQCDVFLCDAPQAFAEPGITPQVLCKRLPQLVVGIASTFGLEGPYAGKPGGSLEAQALCAMAWVLGEPGREPLSLPPGIVEHQAGAMLASGVLLALHVRDDCGSGRVVDVALADVLASYVAGNCRFYVHHGLKWARSGRRASGSGGAYPFMILPCKDGAVCVCGRTREEWQRLVAAMGNPAWAAEPRYQELRAMGTQYPDEVDALVAPWFASHTKAELEAIALANNLIVSPLRDMGEVLGTAHFTQRGFFEPGAIAGKKVILPGLPFRVLESRSASAPNIAPILLRAAPPAMPAASSAAKPRPLAGMRILDFGWVWSAPWVSTFLCELGAQVIKVEHAKRPDNLRLSGRVMRDGKVVEGPSKEISPMYHQVNHGKLGITLNAKEPRAVELLLKLAARSDLVVENMSPGSMERTGLGFENLSAVNPRLVMLAMSSAGQFGELANMRAYAPTMSSFVGMESLVGYRGEAPIGALNVALGDPNAAAHGLVAVLAALRRARLTGRGCYIDLSQNEALLGSLRPYFLESQVRGMQPAPMGNAHPGMAPHGIYPASGDDQWIALSVADDVQWKSLAALATGMPWAGDARFFRSSGRLAHAAELDALIRGWTAMQPRDALVERLHAAGLACMPVLSVEEQWRHPHFAARGLRHPVELPIYGPDTVCSAPWRFSDFAPIVERCGPTTGQHNQFVFGDILGLPGEEIAELRQSGVIA